jgi:hypothetical protein
MIAQVRPRHPLFGLRVWKAYKTGKKLWLEKNAQKYQKQGSG